MVKNELSDQKRVTESVTECFEWMNQNDILIFKNSEK